MISRREMIAATAAAGAVYPGALMAAGQCDQQMCTVGVPSFQMQSVRQRCPQWCWAASLQSIFATQGRYVDQEAIVTKLFGGLVCQPAAPWQIWAAARGNWIDRTGRYFAADLVSILDVQAGVRWPNAANVLITELAAGYPMICGTLGHATVISAAGYTPTPAGPIIRWIRVRDPWPDNPSMRILNIQEFASMNFLARVVNS